ncbi:GNAT family N-acetyltransferase [Microbacterium sp. NPDC089189]|uniref:GNAT family N-acetyltransferase n=1 Tax=Microbacterium sp. NPDC089189 TaxID=3154972 RepID=UPI00341692B8
MTVDIHRAPLREIPADTLYRILWLRVQVFVVEQEAAYPELDGRDLEPDAELLWAEEGGQVIATLRVLHDGDNARIGRVATALSARGRGVAADLMRPAVARAEERWPRHPILLDAQQHLAPWYGRFGFAADGDVFHEDGIPHVPMRRGVR